MIAQKERGEEEEDNNDDEYNDDDDFTSNILFKKGEVPVLN
jgi:hypothetical protein